MVLLSELGMAGGFAYAAWQVVGQWYRFRSKTTQRLDDTALFAALEEAVAREKSKSARTEDFGLAARQTGQGHLFDDWKRLPLNLRAQFVEDLAELALWSGQGKVAKALRAKDGRSWKQLSTKQKARLLGALDSISFEFVEQIKESGSDLADAWLWQPTEALPMLSNEPLAAEAPSTELAALLRKHSKAEAAVRGVLDAQRAAQLEALKGAVQPLAVTQALRNLQVLKSLLETLGLESKSAAARGAEVRGLLTGLALEPASAHLKAEVEAAEAALKEAVEAEVEKERGARAAGIEAAARSAYVAHIVKAAESAEAWKSSSPLLAKVMLVEAVLGELGSSNPEEAGTKELAAAASRLVPKLAALLSLEVSEDHVEGLSGGAPASAAFLVRTAISSAAGPLLVEEAEAEAKARATSGSPAEVVKAVVEGIFSRVTGAPPKQPTAADLQAQRDTKRKELEEQASAASAAVQLQEETKLERELGELRGTSTKRQLAELADRAAAGEGMPPTGAEKLMLLTTQIKNLLSGGTSDAELPTAAAPVLIATDVGGALLEPASAAALAAAKRRCVTLKLSADVERGLDMGPGVSSLLTRVDAYLEGVQRDLSQAAAATQVARADDEDEDEEGEGAAKEAPAGPKYDSGKVQHARQLVAELQAEGLVLLELQGAANRKLQTLRETVDSLRPDMDAAVWNRSTSSLKELKDQLGPIGAAVDARLAEVSDEAWKDRLLATRTSAVTIYRTLNDFLTTDSGVRTIVLQDLAQIKELASGIKVADKKSPSLEAALTKLGAITEKAAAITQAIQPMPGSEDAISEVYVMEEQVDKITPLVRGCLQYVRLREVSLKAGAVAAEPVQMEIPSLAEGPQVERASEGVWMSLADAEDEELAQWHQAGCKLIARGQAAVVLMAGGVDGEGVARVTKDVGLPSTKSLLQLFAERLVRVQALAAEALHGPGAGVIRPVHWYIVATPATKPGIEALLKEGHHFGMEPSQVHVVLNDIAPPVLSEELKVVMEAPYKVARAQGGSGELFSALRRSGALQHMSRNGVRCLDVHSVDDNILARVADPAYLGFCHSVNLDCASKVMEPDAVLRVYEDYAAAAGAATDEEVSPVVEALGGLVPATGAYYMALSWVKQVDALLQREPTALYRLAPVSGVASKGSKVQGYRLDRRISDFVVLDAVEGQQSGFVVVDAGCEFSPVWGNAPLFAPESEASAVEDLLLLHTSWVEAAGGSLPSSLEEGSEEAEGESNVVEVSPLVSYGGEGLEPLVEGRSIKEAYDLDLQGYAAQGGRKSNVGAWFVPFALAYVALAGLKVASSLK